MTFSFPLESLKASEALSAQCAVSVWLLWALEIVVFITTSSSSYSNKIFRRENCCVVAESDSPVLSAPPREVPECQLNFAYVTKTLKQ